ncbi:MAG: hypothetical protein IPK26_04000 [Planctomycetes bacterium]|nr:hypothetical protein [Planctomycetota bacterium]
MPSPRCRWFWLPLLLWSCGDGGGSKKAVGGSPPPPAEVPAAVSAEQLAAEVAIAQGRCLACHPATGEVATRLSPVAPIALEGIAARRDHAALAAWIAAHQPAHAAAAADITAWLGSLTTGAGLQPAAIGVGQIERGEQVWLRSGCVACHDRDGMAPLAERTDHASLLAFLREPTTVRPDLVAHDFLLPAEALADVAAWLLRSQLRDPGSAPPVPGLHYECYEFKVQGAELPKFEGRTPSAAGTTTGIDVARRTRDNNFALRFVGEVQAAVDGDYRFVAGADDCVWLWLDGKLVIENAQVAPHRRREVTLPLTAGWHGIELVYTEVAGGESLELLWQPPGGELVTVPATALAARTQALVPVRSEGQAPEPAVVARGRAAWGAARCGACHGSLDGVLPPPPARAFEQLGNGPCAQVGPSAAESLRLVRRSLTRARSAGDEVRFAMLRDGCTSCHVRDGIGGMTAAARSHLVETEDLGDEGRVPPDLTRLGHRLQPAWVEGVLNGKHRVRPYMQVRMPKISAERAAWYAAAFERADAVAGDTVAPPFAADAVLQGQQLAGNGGLACITCHTFGDSKSLGVQGMDLSIQHERVKPQWFREWLEQPNQHRPGTRMPAFWPMADERRNREIDALWQWSSLGRAAPLPAGARPKDGSLILQTGDRPVLHGAFLQGLSARCIAVATRERTHWAYDLAHARLAWLWRGAFLDAGGTWNGRAGEVLQPKGEDHVVLPDGPSFSTSDGQAATVAGWRLDKDGHPIFQLRIGGIAIDDAPRPRWSAGGSELVRRVTVHGGSVVMRTPPLDGPVNAFVNNQPVIEVHIADGATAEVTYRW